MEKQFLIITPLRIVPLPLEPSLASLSLYTYALKNGLDGDLLDFNTIITEYNVSDYDNIIETTINQWLSSNPEVKLIGISILYSALFERAYKIAKVIKQKYSDVIVAIGGHHPTIFYKEILENCPEIDYVIIGEGEEQFISLLKMLTQKTQDKDDLNNGIAYLSEGRVTVKEKSGYIQDLASLGVTNYDQVDFPKYFSPDMATYYNPKKHDIICAMPISTSRACPYSCNFCGMKDVMGPKFRSRPVEIILEELKILYYEHDIRYFRIIDDCCTAVKKRAMKLFSAIAKSDMDISFEFMQGLSIRTLDDELIDAIVEAGMIRGGLAIESGSEYLRNKIMNKNLSDEKIYNVINYFEKKHPHVWIIVFFLIGLPEETVETLEANISMIRKFKRVYPIANVIVPLPGTILWDQCVKDDLFRISIQDVWKESLWAQQTKSWCSDNSNDFEKEDRYIIQPYNLSIEQLDKYHTKLLDIRTEVMQKVVQQKLKKDQC